MIVWLKFAGWFQCRLATDPDPTDETRGVSGYVRAVAGEPDLDRVIRLQPTGGCPRSHCPPIGVSVVEVHGDPRHQKTHPLVGAAVEFLDNPKFEGRNHILAEDGLEAVVPCHVRVQHEGFSIKRQFSDTMKFPPTNDEDLQLFGQLQATGINVSPGAIGDATGIFDLSEIWRQRTDALNADLAKTTSDIEKAALAARVKSMSTPANARYFAARMLYSVPLGGSSAVVDVDSRLPGKVLNDKPWPLEFWCGGWDADALCGYMVGYLGVPVADGPPTLAQGLAGMMADPRQERR